MPNISLTLACGPYAHTAGACLGPVRLEGIDLTFLPIESPPEIFTRMMANQAFDVVRDVAVALLPPSARRATFPFVALPVFPLRKFRHSFIVIKRESGVRVPQDLTGRRMGVMEYSQTAAVWIRGMLQDEYGVTPESIHWFTGGVNQPGHPKALQQNPIAPVSIEYIGEQPDAEPDAARRRARCGHRRPAAACARA